MLPHNDAHVPREEEVGERRERTRSRVEGPGNGTHRFGFPADEDIHQILAGRVAKSRGQGVGGDQLHRPLQKHLAYLRPVDHIHQQIPDFEHVGKPPEGAHHDGVFTPSRRQIDDVVVEVVLAGPRRHRDELGARGVDNDVAKCPDLRGDVELHHGRESTPRPIRNSTLRARGPD